ncbi:hypothetical protein [Shewanella sp. SR43-8]|uniref:hypothetical protein n=1 Tax=Shewanella sp. SR43-8 TaxID=2760938 RepID=UPI0015FEEE49|nr:hypothetical protein [Shewanella sp. SR43-8]MBB1320732.1 hypothetical protein [Shewanella sp. SR43-8]
MSFIVTGGYIIENSDLTRFNQQHLLALLEANQPKRIDIKAIQAFEYDEQTRVACLFSDSSIGDCG